MPWIPDKSDPADAEPTETSRLHAIGYLLLVTALIVVLAPKLWPFAMIFAAGVILVTFAVLFSAIRVTRRTQRANPSKKAADGIFFVGSQRGNEVWLTAEECKSNLAVIGDTAAGQDETLLALCQNSLNWGSGLLFISGNGDISLYQRIASMCHAMGRDDDLLVLNFMTSHVDQSADTPRTFLSHSMNPFYSASADAIIQLIVSLIESDDNGLNGSMWKARAITMVTAVIQALVWVRDVHGSIDLNIGYIRDHLHLGKIIELAEKEHYPDMPIAIRWALRTYLDSLPGFQMEKGSRQSVTTLDQHGFLQMQFLKIIGNMSDAYAHIFLTIRGDINMHDVIFNRRILVVLLPALSKSNSEIADLGKIIVSSLRSTMAKMLQQAQTSWESAPHKNPISTPPFTCVFDDFPYYTVDGTAALVRQSKSLNLNFVFAAKNLVSTETGNHEIKSVLANVKYRMEMNKSNIGSCILTANNTTQLLSAPIITSPKTFSPPNQLV